MGQLSHMAQRTGIPYSHGYRNAARHYAERLQKPFLYKICPSATNWQSVSKLKKPGMLRAASLQAVAHGSDSVQYFQLRQSRGSSEKFHGAVIDHYGGEDTRVFGEVTEVGEALDALGEMAGSCTSAQAAVIYDWENRWAMEDAAGPRNKNLYYKEAVEKSYYAFRKLGLDVDVIDMEQELDPVIRSWRHRCCICSGQVLRRKQRSL